MFHLRTADERGHSNFGWLNSKHSFSFGHYYNSQNMGISALRVINDDTVKPGAGFDTHGHRDMEIISYVLSGAIEHRDSEGNNFIVRAGEVQRMSAGTGVTHSEFNHSKSEDLHFLQVWIKPNRLHTPPSYAQKKIDPIGQLTPLVTPDGRDGSLSIQQDASIILCRLATNENLKFDTQKRHGYLHVIEGSVDVNGNRLKNGDALGAYQENLQLKTGDESVSALWFDLPADTEE